MKQDTYQSLFSILKNCCEKYSNHVAIAQRKGDCIIEKSYQQVFDRIIDLRAWYWSLPYQRVGILGKNSIHWIEHAFAAILAGKQTVLIDSMLGSEDVKCLIHKAEVEVVLMEEEMFAHKEDLITAEESLVFYSLDFELPYKENVVVSENEEYYEGNFLVFTSGTSSAAKLVQCDNENYQLIIDSMIKSNECVHLSRVFFGVPCYHILGLQILLAVFYKGETACFSSNYRRIREDLQALKPTILIAVPSIIEFLNSMQAFNRELKDVLIGGADCRKELVRALKDKGIEFQIGYGLSETFGGVAISKVNDESMHLHFFENVKTKCLDQELLVDIPWIFKEYYHDRQSTIDAFKDSYFCTGDLIEVQEDNSFIVIGRNKEIIVLDNGEKVSCKELDHKIMQFDSVKEGAVFESSNKLFAAIVLEHDEDSDLIMEQISQYNYGQPFSKRITNAWIMPELPRTTTGKIKRWRIKELYERNMKNG